MPLHLLGKKSWNVYNADNVARVRRDEAAAQAREEAEEQRMQEQDAERRLAILRGEVPPPLEDTPQDDLLPLHREQDRHSFGGRKRKRAGEDDTDFEMRLAKERAEVGSRVARELAPPQKSLSLVDRKGHISLFGEADLPPQKNEEAEKEAAQKKREYMDQYQMRMANAAGRDGQGLTDGGPWYASADGDAAVSVPSKNVFGKHDPKRKVREATRLDASDPLAMMKRSAAKVRELEKERRKENEERGRELEALKNDERREKKRRRREEHEKREHSHRRRSRSRERERRGSRRDRSRSRNRRRSRSRDRDRDRHQDRDRRESPHNDNRNQNREDRGSHRHRSHRSDNDRHGDRDRSRDRDGEKSRDRHRDRDRDRRSKDTETKEGSRPTQR